ncbi:MAG TPA: hypothetical protein VIW24_26645 [Aldersonia sp.]
MNLRNASRALIAGTAVLAALTMTACGSDDGGATTTTTAAATTTTATANADLPPVPTVEELNTQLQTALDPAVPADQKGEYVQGIAADPAFVNQLADAFNQAGATVVVTDVQDFGDTVQANATLTLSGQQPNLVTVPFVPEDGKWKIEKSWACMMLTTLQIQSPSCA